MLTARKFCFAISFSAGLFQTALASELAGPKDLLSTGMNALGYAGWKGDLNAWWELGTLEVSPKLKLPIRFNFSSMQDRSGNSILGWNWWMPLMESNVVKDKEDHISAHLLGGQKIDLWKSTTDPFLYRSPDHQWEARVDERGNFKATNRTEGIAMDFFRGRLKSMALATGEVLSWNYDFAGKPLSLKNGNGNSLLKIDYDSRGFVKMIEYQGKDKKAQYIKTSIEDLTIMSGQVFPALTKLDAPENYTKGFKYENTDEITFSLVALNQVNFLRQEDEKYTWNVLDGTLVSAEGESYQTIGNVDKVFTFTKTFRNGETKSFHFDPNRGIGVTKQKETTIERFYVLTNGPAFGKPKSICVKNILDATTEQTKLFYDQNGILLRTNRSLEGKKSFQTYSSNLYDLTLYKCSNELPFKYEVVDRKSGKIIEFFHFKSGRLDVVDLVYGEKNGFKTIYSLTASQRAKDLMKLGK